MRLYLMDCRHEILLRNLWILLSGFCPCYRDKFGMSSEHRVPIHLARWELETSRQGSLWVGRQWVFRAESVRPPSFSARWLS